MNWRKLWCCLFHRERHVTTIHDVPEDPLKIVECTKCGERWHEVTR